MRLLHVADDNLLKETGFSQQFFMEVLELKKQRYDVSVLAFCHVKFYLQRSLIKALREKYMSRGVNIYIMPTVFPGRFLLEFICFPFAWVLFLYLSFIKRFEIFHFHISYYMFMFLPIKLIMPVKAFTDIHGVVIEESIFRCELKQGSLLHRYANFKEKIALKYSDVNFCVSENMINYYVNKHNLPFNHFVLTRSSFDPEIFKSLRWDMKEKSKQQLGLKEKKVLIYMGHKSAWQQTVEVIRLYSELKQYIFALFFIFLTNDIEGVKKKFREFGISGDDYMIKYVNHEEVPLYSYSADAAIITRAESIVNKAASPIKFSEYLASGAVVLISHTIGDLPTIVEKNGIGVVLSDNGLHESVAFLTKVFESEERQRAIVEKCREVADKEFSIRNTIDIFRRYYES